MKRIEWKPKALRQLRKIKERDIQLAIYDAVDDLKNFPNCSNVKKLKSRNDYRLRVGRWRVIFSAVVLQSFQNLLLSLADSVFVWSNPAAIWGFSAWGC